MARLSSSLNLSQRQLSFNPNLPDKGRDNLMVHQINCYENVVTVRLDGRVNALEVYQDLRNALDQHGKQPKQLTVILDVTLVSSLDAQAKSMIYRALQHHALAGLGICGVNPDLAQEINEWLLVLRRITTIEISPTEADLRVALGLTAPVPAQRKLSGMLAYLDKNAQGQ
jgi:hypothetical protein